jgi:riboflavin kinase/FMN adenylyltransferase
LCVFNQARKVTELIRGSHNLKPHHRGCVATIGNFDGMHRGHQAVIGQLVEKARELRLETAVMLFEPQPQEFFQPTEAAARLTRFREKFHFLQDCGVDRVLCMRFNARMAAMPASEFIRRIVVNDLGAPYLVVGDDFHFGKNRQGDFALLQQAGQKYHFEVAPMRTVTVDGQRVSSTHIRQLLAAGDFGSAEKLLGRPYSISGHVMHGDKRGRMIGVPTANISLRRRIAPLKGVYVVEVIGLEAGPLAGVANIGTRPTVDGLHSLLEVHLFNFAREIYRRYVEVRFLHKLRDEQRFVSLEELKRRIFADIEEAQAWLNARKTYR